QDDARKDIGLGLGAADEDGTRGRDQGEGKTQHETDAGGAAARLTALARRAGSILRRRVRLRHDRRGIGDLRLVLSAPAGGSAQGSRRLAAEQQVPPPRPSARFSKFVIQRGTFEYELRKPKGTSNSMILVPLFDLKFLRRTRGTRCRNFKSAALVPGFRSS